MYTSPENFFAMDTPLARFMLVPFYPFAADAWALTVVIMEVREWSTSGRPPSSFPAAAVPVLYLSACNCFLDGKVPTRLLPRVAAPTQPVCDASEPPASLLSSVYCFVAKQVCDALPALLPWSPPAA